jgi:hypothetical protein
MADPGTLADTAQPSSRNRGRPAGPSFCGSCGQPLDDRRRPLHQPLGEVLSDWLSLDGRLLAYIYAKLMNWTPGVAVAAALWQV